MCWLEKESKFPGPIIQVTPCDATAYKPARCVPGLDPLFWLFNGAKAKYPMQVPGGSQVNVGNLVKYVQSATRRQPLSLTKDCVSATEISSSHKTSQ